MRNAERYKSLEERAYQLEFNYKNEAGQLQNSEMTKINELLEEIVTNYSKDNSIDIVINSNHIIYSKSELDITEDIINYFKENDLFVEIEDFETEMS
jgi:Skp family chaperone for outer membrane proteins